MQVKEIIAQKGFTIGAVADALGKSISGMSQIVNNDNTPPQTLRKIAKVIGCNVSEFFIDEDTEQSSLSEESKYKCPHCGKPLHIVLSPLDEA